MDETLQFTRIVEKLGRLWPTLPAIAATVAVNFSKQRFVQQNWVGNTTVPWKQRQAATRLKSRGRAILVKTARLKRDVKKIYANASRALVGTTRLTVPYAKAHNEGFKGTVTVKKHTRRRFKRVREQYTDRKGKQRNRTSKQVDAGKGLITVGTHTKKINLPQRKYLGASPVMDKQIERALTAAIIKTIKS